MHSDQPIFDLCVGRHASDGRTALVWLGSGGSHWRKLSYAQLCAAAQRLAGHWHRRHQIQRGARVGLLLPPGDRWLIGLCACLYLGATAVPIDPRAPLTAKRRLAANELSFAVTDSDALIGFFAPGEPAPGQLAGATLHNLDSDPPQSEPLAFRARPYAVTDNVVELSCDRHLDGDRGQPIAAEGLRAQMAGLAGVLEIGPGASVAAPGSGFARFNVHLCLAALFSGASTVLFAVDDWQRLCSRDDPSVTQLRVDVLGVDRDLLEVHGQPWPGTKRWFYDPAAQLSQPRVFVDDIGRSPVARLPRRAIHFQALGACLASVAFTNNDLNLPTVLKPLRGLVWRGLGLPGSHVVDAYTALRFAPLYFQHRPEEATLQWLDDEGPRAAGELETPEIQPECPGNLVLMPWEEGWLMAASLPPFRDGRLWSKPPVLQAVAGALKPGESCVAATARGMVPTHNLVVFVPPDSNRNPVALRLDLLRHIERALGRDHRPDQLLVHPLVPHRGGEGLDHDWVQTHVESDWFREKTQRPIYRGLHALRAALVRYEGRAEA